MANLTISPPQERFPGGTSVALYSTANWPGPVDEEAAPRGTAVSTVSVTTGQLAFTGLTNKVVYAAYALVGSEHRYLFVLEP